MQSVNVTLPSSTGTAMAGTIDFPDTPPKAFAIFAHCFAGSRHTPGAARVSKQLTNFGIATLRFDFPGLGQSEGNFGETNFSQNVADIQAAAEWLSHNYSAPQLLMGHSLGGAASLAAANDIRSLKAVATIGAPFDPAHSVLHYADKIGEVDANGEVEVTLGGRALTISRHFLEDLAETNPEAYLPRLRKPLLLLHSPIDQTVGIDNAQNIFLITRYPKSLVALDKADHLVTKQGAAARAADLIGAWAEQYIVPENLPEPVDATAAVAIPAVGTRMGVIVRSNEHTVAADRTKKAGGKGQGFTAEGLLMSALATATTQELKAAGKEHKVDAKALEAISVTITQDSESAFTRTISLPDSLSTAHRTALLDASMATPIDALLNATVTTTIVTNEAIDS
ncbi:bifunctional alpha/beta hydrolase/OsmC family protein [Corynebacterium minutissimum]|uniref:bifunctional alpha/beta hydrolase/OsmC family protein n=1 Tax=Corynebacterium sp. MSK218 TaxID=3050218 RepID=UPI00254D78A5|nr:alpha/beta fold hydrolase [Corynebacterium sp. MSK218]MDK8762971.1 alpha/beta fold hydrolase [Corynebacterium sp. MSK218]